MAHVTPIKPLERGDLWCCFDQRGVLEFFMHPEDAAHVVEHGIVLDGQRFPASKLDEYPAIGAVQVRVRTDAVGEWVEAAAA